MTTTIDDMLASGFEDFRHFINPLISVRAGLLGEPLRVRGTQHGKMVSDKGLVEDFHGTQAYGHRNPAITQAVQRFLESDIVNWYPARVSPFAGSLARRLCEKASQDAEDSPYSNVFFANSGSGGVEAAIKLARAATGKPRIISLRGAYHGCTMGSCALMEEGMFRDIFGPHVPGVQAIWPNDVAALEKALAPGDVAAVVVEPIQVEGGVWPLEAPFIEKLCALTGGDGPLLVADEVQTGLGRTGKFLASQDWPRRPDCVVLGKHLGGGLLPISAMLTRREIFEKAYAEHYAAAESHNSTFSGNAMVCVAAHAALDLLTDETIERVKTLGEGFRTALCDRLARHSLFEEVRGEGLLVGIGLKASDHPWLSFEHFGVHTLADKPTTGVLLCHRLYKRGYYCFVCGHDWRILRILPRFTITEDALGAFVDAIDEELEYLCDLS